MLQRRARLSNNLQQDFVAIPAIFSESRLGIDGRWDIFCGLWFESVMLAREYAATALKREQLFTLGADYTIPLGPGITLLTEYFHRRFDHTPKLLDNNISFYAISVRAAVGLFDNFNAILYYDSRNKSWFRFLNWQRNYNNWQFNFIAFWNPQTADFFNGESANSFAGKGGQLMIVFNH